MAGDSLRARYRSLDCDGLRLRRSSVDSSSLSYPRRGFPYSVVYSLYQDGPLTAQEFERPPNNSGV